MLSTYIVACLPDTMQTHCDEMIWDTESFLSLNIPLTQRVKLGGYTDSKHNIASLYASLALVTTFRKLCK